MQPLGGKHGRKTGKGKGRRGGIFSRGFAGRNSNSKPGLLLRTTGSWRGVSQKIGARGRGGFTSRLHLAGRARVAAILLLFGAAGYGILVGGYVQKSAKFMSSKTKSMVVRAGFSIERLTIEGQNRTSDQQLVEALDLGSRQSMLSFDSAAAQGRLEKLPWVRNAEVMRLLPSRLHIVIVERAPFAIWQRDGETHLVDPHGVVIAPTKATEYPDLPFVVGAGAAKEAKGLFDLLEDKTGLRKRLRAAVRVAERRWNLKLDNGVEIRLPEENIAYAIGKLDALDREHSLLSSDIAAVDLRFPDRVTIRLSKEAAAKRDAAFERSKPRTTISGRDT